jgi:hypothetical protein
MTTNLGGFDDFQGMSLWRDSDWTSVVVPIAANANSGLIYDRGSSFASMRVRGRITGSGLRISIWHYRTPTDLNPLLSHQFVAVQGFDFLGTFPMLSNYFLVQWQAATAAPSSLDIGTQQLNVASEIAHWYSYVHELGATALVLANGVTQQFSLPSLYAGPAHVWFRVDGAPANVDLRIDTYDENLVAAKRLIQIFATDTVRTFAIQIPQTYWTATVSNFSGANATCHFGISINNM